MGIYDEDDQEVEQKRLRRRMRARADDELGKEGIALNLDPPTADARAEAKQIIATTKLADAIKKLP